LFVVLTFEQVLIGGFELNHTQVEEWKRHIEERGASATGVLPPNTAKHPDRTGEEHAFVPRLKVGISFVV
jgi:hypothetical protein